MPNFYEGTIPLYDPDTPTIEDVVNCAVKSNQIEYQTKILNPLIDHRNSDFYYDEEKFASFLCGIFFETIERISKGEIKNTQKTCQNLIRLLDDLDEWDS